MIKYIIYVFIYVLKDVSKYVFTYVNKHYQNDINKDLISSFVVDIQYMYTLYYTFDNYLC